MKSGDKKTNQNPSFGGKLVTPQLLLDTVELPDSFCFFLSLSFSSFSLSFFSLLSFFLDLT